MVERDTKVPWEQCPVRKCRVKRQDMGLKYLYLRDNLRRVHQEAVRGVVSEDREVRWKRLGAVLLRRGA